MEFQENHFHFETKKTSFETAQDLKVFDVRLRLGNVPIVKNLYRLFELKEEQMPAEMQVLYEKKDLYSIIHAIGVVSQGSAIEELVYDAEMLDLPEAQTLDLMPNTRFKEWLKGDLNMEVALSASGNISAEIPEELSKTAALANVDLGGGIQLKTGTENHLTGKFTFSMRFPVVQSMGIASNKCTWILNPDSGKSLNGDQILMQIIAVPKGTQKLKYRISGEITADKGLFWKKKTQRTQPMDIEITL